MFANLKNKLLEEVKSSKLQQFANAAQAAVSSSSSTTPSNSDSTTTTNENFFSITEEDTPQNSPFKPLKLTTSSRPTPQRSSTPQSLNGTGTIPRTRKLSNSSMASDISFRLPSYDSSVIYHMQSDIEMSGSEMDDTASSSKLDAIPKEKLYEAYRKSLDRYNKYRCRYTDLAKKYKDLERDSTKARSVLVETQEKAIRRISELREQCALEQQAKAHLEEALRMEMDDMNCKMQAYQTKLKLVGENPDNIFTLLNESEKKANEQLIDLETSHENTNGSLINLSTNNEMIGRIELLEKQLEEREKQLLQLQEKYEESNKTIEKLKLQEEENSFLLAQTKQAIHSELENKEKEVTNLNENIKQLQNELTATQKKETQLHAQVEELNGLKTKLKSIETAKQESDAKVIATDHMYSQVKEKVATKEKTIAELEEKLNTLTSNNTAELDSLRKQNQQLNEMLQRYQANEVSLANVDNELDRAKGENETLRTSLKENEEKLLNLEKELELNRKTNEKNKEEQLNIGTKLVEEKSKLQDLIKQIEEEKLKYENEQQRVKQLEIELRVLNEQNANNESETITTLKAELHKINEETREQLNALREQIADKEKELKATTNKMNKFKKQHETQQIKITTYNEELEKIKKEQSEEKVIAEVLHKESRAREEQIEREKNELKNQVANILQEITQMEEQLRTVRESQTELEAEKRDLENKIENIQKQAQLGTQTLVDDLGITQGKLKQMEQKLQTVESENSQLLEKNCLLEESTQRLEKHIIEFERLKDGEEANTSEMRLKLATAEDTIQKLNEKMSKVFDENSRMQNAQELMEHDYRTLQDRCDALEKEKLVALDAQKCIESESAELKEKHKEEISRQNELIEELQKNNNILNSEKSKLDSVIKDLRDERVDLTQRITETQALQIDESKFKQMLHTKQEELVALHASKDLLEEESQNEIKKLRQSIELLEEQNQAYEKAKEESLFLRIEKETLQNELEKTYQKLTEKDQVIGDMRSELENLRRLKEDLDSSKQEIHLVKEERLKLEHKLEETNSELTNKSNELSTLQKLYEQDKNDKNREEKLINELEILKEIESKLQIELADAKTYYEQQLSELVVKYNETKTDNNRLHETNNSLKCEIENLQTKQQLQLSDLESSITKLQNEKELLQKQNKPVETINQTAFEELKIENEYLNKLVKQLENDIEKEKNGAVANALDSEELKVKFKSLQCEIYVLKETAESYEKQLKAKDSDINMREDELKKISTALTEQHEEVKRQKEHIQYITDQNDHVQKQLLHTQHQLVELEQKLNHANVALNESHTTIASQKTEHQTKIIFLETELANRQSTITTLQQQISDISQHLAIKEQLEAELNALKIELEERTAATRGKTQLNAESTKHHTDAEHLREINEKLQRELEDLQRKARLEIETLQHENDDLQCSNKQMEERIVNLETICTGLEAEKLYIDNNTNKKTIDQEKADLEVKLKTILSEVQEVSNRNLFLEQKCENYLILEQSNERLKLQNSKLSRQLDETLVSMQHNEGVSANTEFEYLRNIMFQYLTGSANGNNETLVKVISAVLKFSPQQTQVALEKEHQRRSLINKII